MRKTQFIFTLSCDELSGVEESERVSERASQKGIDVERWKISIAIAAPKMFRHRRISEKPNSIRYGMDGTSFSNGRLCAVVYVISGSEVEQSTNKGHYQANRISIQKH